MEALLESLDAVFRGPVLVGHALVALMVSMLASWAAHKGWPRAPLLAKVAGVLVLAVAALGGLSVHEARATLIAAFGTLPVGQRATAMSAGISGQFNAIPFTMLAVTALGCLGIAGPFGFSRMRRAGAWSWPPASYVLAGLAAILTGTILWSAHFIRTFAELAGTPPEEKVAILAAALPIARRGLERFASVSTWTIVGMIVAAVAVTLRRRDEAASADAPRRPLVAAAVALVTAGALWLAARPMRAENEAPWPFAPLTGDVLLIDEPVTPDLEGPDPVERAPVLQVFDDKLALDGYVSSLKEVGSKLWTLRQNFAALHGGAFNRSAVVIIGAAVPIARVRSVLLTLQENGYRRPLLTFSRKQRIVRPTFGTLQRIDTNGVRVTLLDPEEPEELGDSPEVAVRRIVAFSDYGSLARELVTLRRDENDVVLDLGE